MDRDIIRLQQIYIGGQTGDIAPLISFADSVIAVGTDFVHYLEQYHEFQPKYLRSCFKTVHSHLSFLAQIRAAASSWNA